MNTLPNDEIEEWLERSHSKRDLALEIAESNEQPPAFELARRSREIAVYNLLLEDIEKTIEWFTDATEWFDERWDQLRGEVNEPQMAMWALFTAICSRRADLLDEIAKKVASEGIEYQSPQYYVHLDDCLANLVLGNDDAAVEAANALTAMEPDAPERVGSYPGLGDACRAIVDGNTAALDVAFQRMLDRQEELAGQRAKSLDHILICFPATAFALLARERGIAVEELNAFESEYVPKALFE